jgi:hypothetical protein
MEGRIFRVNSDVGRSTWVVGEMGLDKRKKCVSVFNVNAVTGASGRNLTNEAITQGISFNLSSFLGLSIF